MIEYKDLENKLAKSKDVFYQSTQKINHLQEKWDANSALQKQIITYSKIKEVYVNYRKASYSKKFLAEHESKIILHKAAKKFFDDFSKARKKVPSMNTLKKEYGELLAEKKEEYALQKEAKDEMQSLLKAKANIDEILRAQKENEKEQPSQDER